MLLPSLWLNMGVNTQHNSPRIHYLYLFSYFNVSATQFNQLDDQLQILNVVRCG